MKKRIKLIKAKTIGEDLVEAGTVIELESEPADALVAEGDGVEYTAEMQAADDLAKQEALAAQLAAEQKLQEAVKEPPDVAGMEQKKMKFLTKAVRDVLTTKAAADFAGTEATEVLGQISRTASLFARTRKMPISGNLKVVYCNSNADSNRKPVVGKVAESTAAATEVTVAEYDAIPVKWFATIPVSSEMAEDVESLEAYLGDELRNQLAINLDGDIVAGAFTSSYGCKGITVDTNALEATFADITAPTKDELIAMTAKIDPGVRANAAWAVSPDFWQACIAELLDDTNLAGQLITVGTNPTLLGYPVVETLSMPAAHPVAFGDFGRYIVGVRRDIRIEIDKSANFNTDETVVKISGRFAGGLAAGKKVFNGSTYASMAYGSEAGAS